MNLAQIIAETHNWMQLGAPCPGACWLEYHWLDDTLEVDGQWIPVKVWATYNNMDQFMNMAPNETIETLRRIQDRCELDAPDQLEFSEMFYRSFHSTYVHGTKNAWNCRYENDFLGGLEIV